MVAGQINRGDQKPGLKMNHGLGFLASTSYMHLRFFLFIFYSVILKACLWAI